MRNQNIFLDALITSVKLFVTFMVILLLIDYIFKLHTGYQIYIIVFISLFINEYISKIRLKQKDKQGK